MKQLKKLTLLSVAVSSVMALSACSNGNSTGGGNNQKNTSPLPQKIEVDLNDKVKVLDQAVNKDVTKVTVDDNQHLVLEVSNPQSELTNKKVGDIVYLPPKTANDLGVFVKIKEIKTNSNGSIQVITEQPDGAEVFDNVNANVTGVKPKILSIIAPNSDLSKVKGLSQNSGLQQGLTGLEEKITIPISVAISKPKRQYSSSAFTSYKRYCAYPKSFAEHKGITYDKALTELEKLCDTALKFEGSVELNIGEIVNTMDIQKNSSGELTAKSGRVSGKISLKDTEFSINGKIKLFEKELRLSELLGISGMYAEQYFKDYQRTSVDGYFAKVAVTGLSADDKKGKIPLGGFVFGAGGAIFVKGTETGIATSLASPLGGVAMVYGIIDATGKISLEVEYVYNSGKKEIGIEQKDNKISAIPQDTVADATAKNQININGEISGETQIGGAIEGDFFLGGVRFANLGGQYVQKRNGSLTGSYQYDIATGKETVGGCYAWGIGKGFIFYGNLALGVEGTLDVGFFKTQGQAGFQYGFMYPEKEKQTDPNFKSDLWKYTNMVGTKKYPEVCITQLPSEFSIEKVQQYSIHPSHLTEVPVNIVIDRKVKNDAGVKYTTPEKYQVQIGKYDPFGFKVNSWSQPMDVWVDDDGIVTLPFYSQVDEYGMPKAPYTKTNRLTVPYGKSVIKIIAIDKLNRKTEKTLDVNIKKTVNIPTITSITTTPQQITTGQQFELIITGQNLPTDRMLTVNGCNAQTQVSLAVDKHIYKCTTPAKATNNHNIAVFDTKGNKLFEKNFKVEQLVSNIVLSNTNLSVGDKIKLTISNLANSIKSVIWNIGGAISNVIDNLANGVEHRFDKAGDVDISATLKDDKNQTVQELTSKVTVASVAVPTVSIKPDKPKQGQDFIAVLNNDGNKEKVVKAVWEYDGKTKTIAQADLYKDITINSNKDELLLKISFYDIYNNLLGITQKSVKLDKQAVQLTIPPVTATKLTATGITLCTDESNKSIVCSLLHSNWLGLKQDGEVQAGQKMSYTRITHEDDECIKDNVTGLIWEQKSKEKGIRYVENTYTWYNDKEYVDNGGNVGTKNGGQCIDSMCDTQDYIEKLNKSNYCGSNKWRMPTIDELSSVVNYTFTPAIDPIFSPTKRHYYLSSTPDAEHADSAWGINFYYGDDATGYKNYSGYIRAVRSN